MSTNQRVFQLRRCPPFLVSQPYATGLVSLITKIYTVNIYIEQFTCLTILPGGRALIVATAVSSSDLLSRTAAGTGGSGLGVGRVGELAGRDGVGKTGVTIDGRGLRGGTGFTTPICTVCLGIPEELLDGTLAGEEAPAVEMLLATGEVSGGESTARCTLD